MFLSSKDATPTDTSALRRPFSSLASLDQQLRTFGPPLGRNVHAVSVRTSSYLSRSGPGVEARPGKFNFGVGTGGDESSCDGGLEAPRSLFRTEAESPSEMSLV